MSLKVTVPNQFTENVKKSAPGVFSLIGVPRKTSQDEVVIFDALKSNELNLNTMKDVKTSLTYVLSHLAAGIHLIGFLVTFSGEPKNAKGDFTKNASSEIRSCLSKALLNLQFQLSDFNRTISTLVGIYFDLTTHKLQSVAIQVCKGNVTNVNSVEIKQAERNIEDIFRKYRVSVDLDMKLSSSNFAEYNSVIEKLSKEIIKKLNPKDVIILSNQKCVKPEDLVNIHLNKELKEITFSIYELSKHDETSNIAEQSKMEVNIKGNILVLGVFAREQNLAWTDLLNDISMDLSESVFYRISQVFAETGQAKKSKSVDIALPARCFMESEFLNIPILAGYDENQLEVFSQNSLGGLTAINGCKEQKVALNSKLDKPGAQAYSNSNMIIILGALVIVLLSIIIAYFTF